MGDSNQVPTISVRTELGTVEVRKLVFGDYAEIIRALDKLPEKIAGLIEGKKGKGQKARDLTTEEILKAMPAVVADSFPEVAKILAVATNKDQAFILKLDLADVLDIVSAALELNSIDRIVLAIKKIQALRAGKPKNPRLQK